MKTIGSSYCTTISYIKQAVKKKFDNASGKYIITNLIGYAAYFISMGTSPSGEGQPGCSTLIKKVARYRNERTPTPSSTSSRSSTPTTDNYSTSSSNSYSDCVDWDPRDKIYKIDVEVKSADHQASDTQIIDQMVGLFRQNQKNMLGVS